MHKTPAATIGSDSFERSAWMGLFSLTQRREGAEIETVEVRVLKLDESANRIQAFQGNGLSKTLASLESEFRGCSIDESKKLLCKYSIDSHLLTGAYKLKELAGQINVIIHAAGILAALPKILSADEQIESLSLGAGNTGRDFDLETNRRVAEFKFINWKGGSETIRQNSIFKDFFYLAESETEKDKFLYVLGCEKPLKFLTGNRSIKSVVSRNAKLAQDFSTRYENQFHRVAEYYQAKKFSVNICDLSKELSELLPIA